MQLTSNALSSNSNNAQNANNAQSEQKTEFAKVAKFATQLKNLLFHNMPEEKVDPNISFSQKYDWIKKHFDNFKFENPDVTFISNKAFVSFKDLTCTPTDAFPLDLFFAHPNNEAKTEQRMNIFREISSYKGMLVENAKENLTTFRRLMQAKKFLRNGDTEKANVKVRDAMKKNNKFPANKMVVDYFIAQMFVHGKHEELLKKLLKLPALRKSGLFFTLMVFAKCYEAGYLLEQNPLLAEGLYYCASEVYKAYRLDEKNKTNPYRYQSRAEDFALKCAQEVKSPEDMVLANYTPMKKIISELDKYAQAGTYSKNPFAKDVSAVTLELKKANFSGKGKEEKLESELLKNTNPDTLKSIRVQLVILYAKFSLVAENETVTNQIPNLLVAIKIIDRGLAEIAKMQQAKDATKTLQLA